MAIMETDVLQVCNEIFDLKVSEEALDMIGHEGKMISSIPAFIKNSVQSAVNAISNPLDTIHGFITGTDEIDDLFNGLQKSKVDIEAKAEKIDFLDLGNRNIAVVPGLKVSLDEAIMILQKLNISSNKTFISAVDELDKVLSGYVSDGDFKKSFSYKAGALESIYEDVKEIPNALSKIIQGDKIDRKPLKDVIGNVKNFIKINDDLKSLSDELKTKDLKRLDILMASIKSRLELINDEMEDGEEISKESLLSIVHSVQLTANILSMLSAYYYMVLQLGYTAENATNLITK